MRHALYTTLSFLLALLIGLVGQPAVAQTPAATIEDDGGTVVLESYADGALLAPGTFGTGTIPTEGAGTRLMWYPAKGAFRAGRVGDGTGGNEWNDGNIGNYSAAFGRNTIASGNNATAMGTSTTAANDNSLTIGQYNNANSSSGTGYLFVIGNGTSTSSNDAFRVTDTREAKAGAHTTFSDRRLKTQITALGGNILSKLEALRPVRYRFKNQDTNPEGDQIGLIAQEVRKEFPELVSKGADKYLSLAYPKFTAVLLKGLQEQQTQIEKQTARIDRQQTTIDSLENRVRDIATMKKRLAAIEARQGAAASRAAGWTGGPIGLLLAALLGGLVTAGALRFLH